jgi:hypothetical protein
VEARASTTGNGLNSSSELGRLTQLQDKNKHIKAEEDEDAALHEVPAASRKADGLVRTDHIDLLEEKIETAAMNLASHWQAAVTAKDLADNARNQFRIIDKDLVSLFETALNQCSHSEGKSILDVAIAKVTALKLFRKEATEKIRSLIVNTLFAEAHAQKAVALAEGVHSGLVVMREVMIVATGEGAEGLWGRGGQWSIREEMEGMLFGTLIWL